MRFRTWRRHGADKLVSRRGGKFVHCKHDIRLNSLSVYRFVRESFDVTNCFCLQWFDFGSIAIAAKFLVQRPMHSNKFTGRNLLLYSVDWTHSFDPISNEIISTHLQWLTLTVIVFTVYSVLIRFFCTFSLEFFHEIFQRRHTSTWPLHFILCSNLMSLAPVHAEPFCSCAYYIFHKFAHAWFIHNIYEMDADNFRM